MKNWKGSAEQRGEKTVNRFMLCVSSVVILRRDGSTAVVQIFDRASYSSGLGSRQTPFMLLKKGRPRSLTRANREEI